MLASAAATTIYDAINTATSRDDLDQLARTMWRGHGEGAIGEDDATFLQSCIDRRRPLASNTPRTAPGRSLRKLAGRLGTRFKPRQHPRCLDRKASRDRRRMLGGSAVMPPNLRHDYTEGQRAVLSIVAGEVKHHGVCDLPIDKIAALAGVCRTTVQTTLHEARRLFHIRITERPQPGRKSLTNVVEIASREWLMWIKRGPTAHRPIGSNSVKMASPTKNKNLRKKEATDETEWRRGCGPPQPPLLRRVATESSHDASPADGKEDREAHPHSPGVAPPGAKMPSKTEDALSKNRAPSGVEGTFGNEIDTSAAKWNGGNEIPRASFRLPNPKDDLSIPEFLRRTDEACRN